MGQALAGEVGFQNEIISAYGGKERFAALQRVQAWGGGRRTATAYVNIFLPNISLGFLNLLITLLDKILARMRGMQALRACAKSMKEMKGMRRDSRVQEGTSHNFK